LSAVVALLREIVEATPPPTSGRDPSELVHEAQAIASGRVALLQQLATALAAEGADAEALALRATLEDRDARWQAALTVARREMNQRMTAMRRYRR
jgi:hypothetical protein